MAIGLILQGMLGLAGMRWVGSVSGVVLYLALEGTVSPLAFGPILPDMLECAPSRDGRAAGKDAKPDEHTTNLVRSQPVPSQPCIAGMNSSPLSQVTSIFTTCFNCGGLLGPLVGSSIIVQVGFRGMISTFACGLVLWGLVVGAYELLAPKKRLATIHGQKEHVVAEEDEGQERQGLLA